MKLQQTNKQTNTHPGHLTKFTTIESSYIWQGEIQNKYSQLQKPNEAKVIEEDK